MKVGECGIYKYDIVDFKEDLMTDGIDEETIYQERKAFVTECEAKVEPAITREEQL